MNQIIRVINKQMELQMNKRKSYQIVLAVFFTFLFLAGCSTTKDYVYEKQPGFENVKAGTFDNGKMWTFDFPPVKYFESQYNFSPSNEWFENARLAALRLPGCSASFVSEDGLVMTNHHCVRGALDQVNREGENLPENGFFAKTLEEERKVPNLYIDQLVLIEDVTDQIKSAFESGKTDEEKVQKRQDKIRELEREYSKKTGLICNVVTFFNGGKYSMYGYKRYTDVRLVFAPETQIAYYGGDYDNFTYPRYDLDVAFYRVYDENGKPLKTKNYFKWNKDGVKEGDLIFVIGNPGRTNRLYTVSQLYFYRDYVYPYQLTLLKGLVDIYSDYLKKHPDQKLKYQSMLFGFSNSLKAFTGYHNGLKDPYLMAKKIDFEQNFRNTINSNPELKNKYGKIWDELAEFQKEKAKYFYKVNALNIRGRGGRSLYFQMAADLIDFAEQMKLPDEKRGPRFKDSVLANTKEKFFPKEINREIQLAILMLQLKDMKNAFGSELKALNDLLSGLAPDEAAVELDNKTIVLNEEEVKKLLDNPDDILKSQDPFIKFVLETKKYGETLTQKSQEIQQKEQAKVQLLGNALFDVYGTSIPPDATFTLRISDGVVKGYEYNGTIAPPFTTFYGMYDRYFSFAGYQDWDLPERWKNPPAEFDLSTPINFVSTADIIGGNSGSPLVNKNLEVVGLAFDGNIESLPGNFIFDDTKNRTVAVHTAGMTEALQDIYDATRIVNELLNGKIVE